MGARHATSGSFAISLVLTILHATSAHAQGVEPSWRGLYVGAGGTYSTVSVRVDDGCYNDCWWGDYNEYDTGDGAYGYSLHAGFRIHPYVALEASYLETGSIRWDENLVYMPEFNDYYNNRVDFAAEVAEASVLGILPLGGQFEAYLRLGAGFYDGVSNQRLDQSFGDAVVTRQVEESGTGFLAGIGFGMTLADAWHVRLDLQTVSIDEDALNARDDTSLDSFLLEVQYRFGARKAAASAVGARP